MAQFLKAKFLSEALKWKANPRHTADQYFAGLRYDPYIYAQARLSFPEYNKRFPAPANKEFTENFAKDLVNPTRNQELLKIINPAVLTPELEATNNQFEVSARLEQQSVAQVRGQPVAQPFSLTAERIPAIPRVPTLPRVVFPQPIGTAAPAPAKVTSVTGAPPTTPPQPQPQPKLSRPSIQVPQIPPSFMNTAKNLGSSAGVFFQRNVGKHLTGDRAMNFLGKAGNAGISALSGISNFGGGRGNIFSSLGGSRITGARGEGIFGRIGGFGRGGGGGGSLIGKAKDRRGLIFLIGILGFMMLTGALAILGTTPTGEAAPLPIIGGTGCPDTSNNKNGFSCHYLNPSINIFDTNISQEAIDSYIKNYSSIFVNAGKGDLEEFKKRVNYIVEKSQQGKLNPAIFLGYWKTESLFSTMGTRDMGCAGNGFYEEVQCALAIDTFSNPTTNPIANCARSDSADSPSCSSLKSIRTQSQFDKTHPINYPIRSFDDFAEAYGPYDHLGSDGLPGNCISTYNKLIEVAKELNACQSPITPPAGEPPTKEFVLSCPIANENNTCSHFDDPRDPCHCNPSQYLSMAACQVDASLYYGIDVGTKASKTALIPYITYQGETTPQSITCQLITAQPPTQPNPQSGGELQQILHYHCSTGKIDLYLQYNHIKAGSSFPTTISSGQIVGDIANYGEGFRRLNIQIGVNGECAWGRTQFCKRGGDYFQCPLQRESPPDY